MTSIADRIAARLSALGKNPSAVALEAGLGRSSVRDIVIGKVASPRLDTLEKLTGPLECTLEFLTGSKGVTGLAKELDDFFDPITVMGVTPIEIGVFRTPEAITPGRADGLSAGPLTSDGWPLNDRHLQYRDLRLPGHYFALYQLNDWSLEDINIIKGDILTVAAPAAAGAVVPMKRGTLILIRRTLSGQQRADLSIKPPEELSVRFVDIVDGDITLVSKSKRIDYAPIRLGDRPGLEDFERYSESVLPNFYWTGAEMIIVDGVVVRVTRPLPV